MKISPFAVEEWMNAYETGAKYNIAETCVDSVSADELFELTGTDKKEFLDAFCARRLTYGDIEGAPKFREGVAKLYKTIAPGNVVTTHGASGANHHVFYSLVEPGDRVISIMPTYQQLYSIPRGYGADVHIMRLRRENHYLVDLDELKKLATPDTKMICINNPNNPTGALLSDEMLSKIAEIASDCGAWLMCDEVYRHLTQTDEWSASAADLYEKGISVGSMSKVFSLAGLRLGWLAAHDTDALKAFMSHRDYNHISCGVFDEALAALALSAPEKLLARNRAIVHGNLSILSAWMDAQPRLDWTKPMAGTTALIYYDFDMPSYEFCERMYRETGAFVTPGDCFEEPKSFRMGYACDELTLKNGLDAMGRFIKILESENR